jgi:hypothetical protein
MYAVTDPVVHQLPPNTPEQDDELSIRTLLIGGFHAPKLIAHCVLHKYLANRQVEAQQSAGIPIRMRPLQAPHGQYQPLFLGLTNIVAVHIKDTGQISAFGPFDSTEDAYDYFPDDSSPHDTTVLVFTVFADVTHSQS